MNHMNKKGQGAMEYLMTYGWALLVIVVVGAALFALGVLNPNTYTQKRCQGFQYVTYQDHNANSTHFALSVFNGNKKIDVTAFSVNGVVASNVATTPAGNISQGGAFVVEGDAALDASGTSYSYPVTVTYDVVSAGGLTGVTDRGTCSGTVA